MNRIIILVCLLAFSQWAFSQVGFEDRVIVDQSGLANRVEGVFTADLDGDGDLDLISASRTDDKIAWYENLDGAGTYSNQRILSTDADEAVAVHAGDIDGDGDMDIVSASFEDDKIAWYENTNGQGNFSEEIIISENIYAIFAVQRFEPIRHLTSCEHEFCVGNFCAHQRPNLFDKPVDRIDIGRVPITADKANTGSCVKTSRRGLGIMDQR